MSRIPILAATMLMLGACSQAAEDRVDEVRTVRVLTVGALTKEKVHEYAAEVRARHETRLGFRVSGKMTERMVEVGASVRAGQPIARLDAADLALAVNSAAAQAASARAERDLAAADLKRFAELRERNFISRAEYDRRANVLATAHSRLQAARAQHRQAANQAGYALLVADADGIVTAIEAEVGQVLSAGQTVARVARPGEKEVAFAVPEAQLEFVRKAAGFEVSLSAFPGRKWKGRLRELSPAADPVTRTYAARVSLLDADSGVGLGMSARIAARSASHKARIELPLAALHARGDAAQVFLYDRKSGSVRLQTVAIGGVSGEHVVIESGLSAGDVVVSAGAHLLRNGQRVRVLPAPATGGG